MTCFGQNQAFPTPAKQMSNALSIYSLHRNASNAVNCPNAIAQSMAVQRKAEQFELLERRFCRPLLLGLTTALSSYQLRQ